MEEINQEIKQEARKEFKLPKSLTTVTNASKLLALFLFVMLPFMGFYVGIRYQNSKTSGEIRQLDYHIQTLKEQKESLENQIIKYEEGEKDLETNSLGDSIRKSVYIADFNGERVLADRGCLSSDFMLDVFKDDENIVNNINKYDPSDMVVLHKLSGLFPTSTAAYLNSLTNPIKIFSLPGCGNVWYGLEDKQNNKIYLSIYLQIPEGQEGEGQPLEGKVYEVDTKTKESEELFTYGRLHADLHEKLGESYGPAEFIKSSENYVIFKIGDCIECSNYDPTPFEPVIILNTNTLEYKIMGTIGGISFDPSENTFSYQDLNEVEVPCEGRSIVGCGREFGGSQLTTEYQLSGEVKTEPLP